MTKEGMLVLIGVLTAASPFIGLPSSWLAYILPVLGVFAALVAITMLRARKSVPYRPHDPVFNEAPPQVS